MKIFTTFSLFLFVIVQFSLIGQEKFNIHLAAFKGNLDEVNQYIISGNDLNKKDQYGSTPLIIAATFGKTEIAKALINGGADLHIRNNEGLTPLHIAALFGRTEIVKQLLDKGVNKYLRNNNGSTAFDIAAAPFNDDIAIYDRLRNVLGPLGLKLDYAKIKKSRPIISEMLRPTKRELNSVHYKPIERNDWQISTPEKHGLNPNLVAELYNDADHLKTIYGLLLIKNNHLIAEKYFNKGSIEQLSRRASVTKSYVSALMGIALEKGYIKSIDEKMIDYFPEIADKISDSRKNQISIRQMLQMRAGFPWEETDSTYWNAIWSGKYINKINDIPLTKEPGTDFQYSNLNSNWLGIIISRACNRDLKTFGEENLFNPLDVKLGGWNKDLDGYYIGCGDIQFTARDMGKFGLLYLNKGKFNSNQLIPANWVKESLESYSNNINSTGVKASRLGRYFKNVGYGYQWWSAKVGNHHFNFAWGHGGQLIILLHDQNMVIVTTADPFCGKEKHKLAWKDEKSIINLVGKFIKLLPY